MEKVKERYVSQLSRADAEDTTDVQVPNGVLSYQAVQTSDDTLLTITVFESADSLRQAQKGAADIRQSLRDFHVEEIETLAGEVRLSHTSDNFSSWT
jgi:hypothetical protein